MTPSCLKTSELSQDSAGSQVSAIPVVEKNTFPNSPDGGGCVILRVISGTINPSRSFPSLPRPPPWSNQSLSPASRKAQPMASPPLESKPPSGHKNAIVKPTSLTRYSPHHLFYPTNPPTDPPQATTARSTAPLLQTLIPKKNEPIYIPRTLARKHACSAHTSLIVFIRGTGTFNRSGVSKNWARGRLASAGGPAASSSDSAVVVQGGN